METFGQLYVISAPSGAGKTSLVKELVKRTNDVIVSVSHTTRSPRPGEKNGKDYFFITSSQFLNMKQKKLFLEHAEVFGELYGTDRESLSKALNSGIDVILEIDWQGATQIMKKCSSACSIFILPPSRQILKQRLINRQQDNKNIINQRMLDSKLTLSKAYMFDYWIVNDEFEDALNKLIDIFKSNRNSRSRILKKDPSLIERLQEDQSV